jgi:NADH:ubiquinone oxidoreductase subunit 4 (subunit M)
MFQRVGMGKPKAEFEHAHIHDLHAEEWLAFAPLLALIVALGVYPQLLFKMTDLPVTDLLRELSRALG